MPFPSPSLYPDATIYALPRDNTSPSTYEMGVDIALGDPTKVKASSPSPSL
jgi:hypothetical protein